MWKSNATDTGRLTVFVSRISSDVRCGPPDRIYGRLYWNCCPGGYFQRTGYQRSLSMPLYTHGGSRQHALIVRQDNDWRGYGICVITEQVMLLLLQLLLLLIPIALT